MVGIENNTKSLEKFFFDYIEKTFVKNLLPLLLIINFVKNYLQHIPQEVKLVLHLNILEIKFLNGDRMTLFFLFVEIIKKKSF